MEVQGLKSNFRGGETAGAGADGAQMVVAFADESSWGELPLEHSLGQPALNATLFERRKACVGQPSA